LAAMPCCFCTRQPAIWVLLHSTHGQRNRPHDSHMQARLVGPEHVVLRVSHVAEQTDEEVAPGAARDVHVALKGQARDRAERAQRRAEARDQPVLQRVDALVQPAARRAADPIRVRLGLPTQVCFGHSGLRELERGTRGMRHKASDTAVQHSRLSMIETISMLNGACIMQLTPAPEQLAGHITNTHGLHEAAKGGTARDRWRGPGARPPTAASRRPPRRPRSRARALCCQLRGLNPSKDAAGPAYAHTLATSVYAVAALRPGGCKDDAAPILLAAQARIRWAAATSQMSTDTGTCCSSFCSANTTSSHRPEHLQSYWSRSLLSQTETPRASKCSAV